MSDQSAPYNEPAFPNAATPTNGGDFVPQQFPGLTVRDYFAAKAMQGMMAGVFPLCKSAEPLSAIAGAAYQQADAMLRARSASQAASMTAGRAASSISERRGA